MDTDLFLEDLELVDTIEPVLTILLELVDTLEPVLPTGLGIGR